MTDDGAASSGRPGITAAPQPTSPRSLPTQPVAPRPISLLAAARLIARIDLVRRIRNRSAIITALAAPLAFAVVFSALISGASSTQTFQVGLVAPPESAQARAVVESMLESDGRNGESARNDSDDESPVEFISVKDRATAVEGVDDGDLSVAVVFPEDFDTVTSGGRADIEVLRSPEREISAQVGEAVAAQIAASFNLVSEAVTLDAEVTGSAPDDATIAAAGDLASAISVTERASTVRPLSGSAFFGASMAMLFLFFTVGFAAQSIIAERAAGSLARVLSAPIPPGAIIVGKCASVAVLGVASYLVVWGVTALALGADWGNPLGVLVLIVATVFALGGVAVFAASLARTDQQAQTMTAVVAFALALLGGNFVGPGGGSSALASLSLLSPNGWALNSFVDLSSGAATVGSVATSVAVLAAFGVVFGTVGLRRIHRLLVP